MSCEQQEQQEQPPHSAGCRGSDRVAVIIGYQSSLHRNFCNACVKEAGIMRQYTGRLLGHCETVECVEGCWPKNYGLGVLLFENARECAKWTHSDPVFRAQDFLEQVEMYCVPLRISIPADCLVLSITDMGPCHTEFSDDEMKCRAESVSAAGGLPCVAATNNVHKVRGLRSPGPFIIDAWRCLEQCTAYYSAQNQQAALRDVIIARLSSNV